MELYIHIPYCRQKCRYCDFASYAGQESTMQSYVDALLKEAALMAQHAKGERITSVFIGGGTPSILPSRLLSRLLHALHELYDISPDAEFTSEANPGTLTREWLRTAAAGGVNRLSLGVQAFQPDLLRTLGRIHTADQVTESVAMAREAGFANISLDLMFGLPGQTRENWMDTLRRAISLAPTHLSCYGLICEEGTPLTLAVEAGQLHLPDVDDERAMYDDAIRTLADAGYMQYEISNFARDGYPCRHNIGYWQQTPYIGLGASAASMLMHPEGGYLRTSNPASIADYIRMVNIGEFSSRESIHVSAEEAMYETLMLGLRMNEGVSEERFAAMHGVTLDTYCGDTLRSLAKRDLLVHTGGRWQLTRRGMDVQNAVLVELMEATEKD